MDKTATPKRWEPWAIGASIVVFVAITLWLIISEPRPLIWVSIIVPNTLVLVSGIVITVRTPQRLIGWILIGLGVGFQISYLISRQVANGNWDEDRWTTAITDAGQVMIALIVVLLLTFPQGTFPRPWWRWLATVVVVIAVASTVYSVIKTESEFGADAFVIGAAAILLLGVFLQVRYYKHRSTEARRQIAWFLLAFGVAAVLYVVVGVTGAPDDVFIVVDGIATSIWPLAILLAITKYRLYEIDRIVSRGVAYVVVLGMLAGVYVLGAVWLPTFVAGGEVPPIYVAGSTLAVIALFNPLRRRVVGWVDRRFNRSRYDAEQVIAGFGDQVRDVVESDTLADELASVVATTMEPRGVGVWVKASP